MVIEPLYIEGSFLVRPEQHTDSRGSFTESFRGDRLAEVLGYRPDIVQANISVSAKGVFRGIHYAGFPVSQAKYITCMSGALLDFIVDIRVGSPTFGRWQSIHLTPENRFAIFLTEGLGHGFAALEDNTTAAYLLTTAYNPENEHEINPLDPMLDLMLPPDSMLSPKDAAAPTLEEAGVRGLLPSYYDWARRRTER